MSHNSAISNPYYMQAVPKERTEIIRRVNGKRAACHRCGPVQVLTVTTKHLGLVPDKDKTREEWEPRSIDLCSRCHAVIQRPAPEPQPKQEKKALKVCTEPPELWDLTAREQNVLLMLRAKPLEIVTYEEFRAAGISCRSRNANLAVHVNAIRRKMPKVTIECISRQGYMLVPEEDDVR
jgi:hypothetical protein